MAREILQVWIIKLLRHTVKAAMDKQTITIDNQTITIELHKLKSTLLGQSFQKAHGFNFQTLNA